MGRSTIPDSMSFRVCVYQLPDEPGVFIAHCLDLDLMGEGDKVESALEELLEVIDSQIETCQRTGANFWFHAPASVWKTYSEARKAGRKIAGELVERVMDRANKRLGHHILELENIVASEEIPEEFLALA